MRKEFAKPAHKVKLRFCELPGLAIAEGKYHGFGSILCTSIEDSADVFDESNDEDTNDAPLGGGSDDDAPLGGGSDD